jgi:hypothetical protein
MSAPLSRTDRLAMAVTYALLATLGFFTIAPHTARALLLAVLP